MSWLCSPFVLQPQSPFLPDLEISQTHTLLHSLLLSGHSLFPKPPLCFIYLSSALPVSITSVLLPLLLLNSRVSLSGIWAFVLRGTGESRFAFGQTSSKTTISLQSCEQKEKVHPFLPCYSLTGLQDHC